MLFFYFSFFGIGKDGVRCNLAFCSRAMGRSIEASLGLAPSSPFSFRSNFSLRLSVGFGPKMRACNCVYEIASNAGDFSVVSGVGTSGLGFMLVSSSGTLTGISFGVSLPGDQRS